MKIQTPKKHEKIAKILGLLEERGKSKDWLLEQLTKNRIKIKVSPTLNSFEILNSCTGIDVSRIFKKISDDDEFSVHDIKVLTKTLHWFFTDIVGSSDPKIPVKIQARKINILNLLIKKTTTFKNRDTDTTYIQSTGDGMAIGFSRSPEDPLRIAIELHKLLNKYNKKISEKERMYLRIGVDSGPIYFIKDVENNETVWGPGIIMARRVMDLCGENQIFASRRIGDDISKLSSEYKEILHPIGDYSIKHGEEMLIYNIYGKNFGNKNAPKKSKVRKPKTKNNSLNSQPNFEFNKVNLYLDIIDSKTMMTHHTWIWDVKNVSSEPLEQVFYDLSGDVVKDFSDLNLSIKDENDNQLEIISLDVNKEHEKKFNVKLAKPIRKNQKNRLLKLEYDWEEPYRTFEYVFSTKCKEFEYRLTAPKNLQLKNRVLEVARELGIKKRVESPPKISYTSTKTEITWKNEKKRTINRFEAFEFQW